jgi:hypothetical protein
MVVGKMIARSEHGESSVELIDHGGAAGRVHLAVERAESTVVREAFADAFDVALVDDEAVTSHELADLHPRLESRQALLERRGIVIDRCGHRSAHGG